VCLIEDTIGPLLSDHSADQVVDFLHKVVLLFLLFSPARSPWLADGSFKVIKFREDLSKVLDNVHVNTSTGRLLTRERVSVGETHVLLVPVGKSTLVLAFGRFFHVKDFDCSIYVERDLILSSPEELVSLSLHLLHAVTGVFKI